MDMPLPTEPLTAAYLARRGVAPQWRGFVRALLDTLDDHLDPAARDALLGAVGRRMADAMPLPHCDTLAELEARINDALAAADWGYCELAVDAAERRLVVLHFAAPVIASAGEATGRWVAAVLEGLYAVWLAGQPGADPSLVPQLAAYAPGSATLHYGREAAA